MISPKPQACKLSPVKSEDIRESLDLIPTLSYMSHHNKEMFQEVKRDKNIGNCVKTGTICEMYGSLYLRTPICGYQGSIGRDILLRLCRSRYNLWIYLLRRP